MRKKLPIAISLIILGSFLEVYYYVWKYTSEGEAIWLSIIKGAALTIFAIGLASLLRRHWLFYLAIILSISYSIFCTSSGQATSYAQRYNADRSIVLTQQREYEQSESDRLLLQNDLKRLTEQKAEKEKARDNIPINQRETWAFVGFDSEGDARYQKAESEVFKTLNSEILSYQEQIDSTRARLDSLSSESVAVNEKETDSYAILHDMTGLNVTAIQYILQSMFSLFAALMAPIGIRMISETEKKEKINYEPYVKFWVKWSWYGFRNGKGTTILSKAPFLEYAKDNYPGFTDSIYEKIKNAAFCAGAIDNNGVILYTEQSKAEEAIKEVLNATGKRKDLCGTGWRSRKRQGRAEGAERTV